MTAVLLFGVLDDVALEGGTARCRIGKPWIDWDDVLLLSGRRARRLGAGLPPEGLGVNSMRITVLAVTHRPARGTPRGADVFEKLPFWLPPRRLQGEEVLEFADQMEAVVATCWRRATSGGDPGRARAFAGYRGTARLCDRHLLMPGLRRFRRVCIRISKWKPRRPASWQISTTRGGRRRGDPRRLRPQNPAAEFLATT